VKFVQCGKEEHADGSSKTPLIAVVIVTVLGFRAPRLRQFRLEFLYPSTIAGRPFRSGMTKVA
jgi:hypothetical protein